jgi:signal transduction histidine kinase
VQADRSAETWVLAVGALLTLAGIGAAHLSSASSSAIFWDNAHWSLSSAFSTLALALAWRSAVGKRRRFLLWALFGFVSLLVGQFIFDVQAYYGSYAVPDYAAGPFLLRVPLLCAGLVALLRNRAQFSRAILDALGFGFLLLSLVLAVYLPHAGNSKPLTFAVLVAYPVEFFFLAAFTFVVLLERRESFRWPTLILGLAPFVNGILWTFWNKLVISGTMPVATPLGDLFSICDLGWAWGAVSWYPGRHRASYRADAHYYTTALWVPILLVLASALALIIALPSPAAVRTSVTLCVVGTVVAALFRQSMLFREQERMLRAESELIRVQEMMFERQRLETLGTIAGGVAHDINNLLSSVFANLEMLESNEVQADSKPVLVDLKTAATHARDTVARILRFARSEPVQKERVALSKLLLDVQRLLRLGLPGAHIVQVYAEPNLPEIMATPSQMHQVLMNLGINSSQAMGASRGEITMRAVMVERGPDVTQSIELTVSDTGMGMDEDTLSRALEPFFTTKPRGVGTGLGLSVVRDIVLEHGGTIEIQSHPGEGTLVTILLPVAPTVTETAMASA